MDQVDGFDSYNTLIEKGSSLIKEGSSDYFDITIDNKKMSIMLFTSGTTSMSKAVALSQSNICEDIYALSQMTFEISKKLSCKKFPFFLAITSYI